MAHKLMITDTILRDAHQSQAATRMRVEDMLPACDILDSIGYYSLECWGGATFDSCLRFLNEDPWDRLRKLKKALPHTKLQMLFRGQNILGYKHYADDVVEQFCRKAIENGALFLWDHSHQNGHWLKDPDLTLKGSYLAANLRFTEIAPGDWSRKAHNLNKIFRLPVPTYGYWLDKSGKKYRPLLVGVLDGKRFSPLQVAKLGRGYFFCRSSRHGHV